jgi:S-adenosylmethionine hydrolase
MKGVIYRIAPDARIVDISHLISPQAILEGSLVWNRSCSFFPEGTVHVGVVDPGVGTQRRPIAARLGKYFYVCPDNGLITPMLEQAEQAGEVVQIVHLDQPRFWLPQISNVFHGRDIFSPVAAHLANGVPLEEVGTPISDPVRRPLPHPERLESGWRGQIVTVDHFGNLGTNITQEMIQGQGGLKFQVAGRTITGLSKTFGEKASGELVAFIDSDGCLAIAIVNGDAAGAFDARPGDPVEVFFNS